jgi:hypothetical protein
MSRQSSYEIKRAIEGIESDIREREKRIGRRERSLDRAGDAINDAIAAEDQAAQAKAEAKAKAIKVEIAEEQVVLDACRENLVRHKAAYETRVTEERAAYLEAAEARRVEVSNFAERMLSRYHNGEMADRFGKIEPDIQNLTIMERGASYLEVGVVVETIKHPYESYESRETRTYSVTVNLPEPKAMQSEWARRDRAEINWPAYGTVDQDITRCFGQMLRVAACIGEWADTLLPSA